MAATLIAESGSTKTDWIVLKKGKKQLHFKTEGINPYLQSTSDIIARLEAECSLDTKVDRIHFYGAGVHSKSNKEIVKSADLLVVASPTFKATYTGLLKLFLDQFGAGELGQTTTFALMLGGSYAHALAPELTLRPVLVEIGASCPAPSLYLLDSDYETSDDLQKWLPIARRFVPGP